MNRLELSLNQLFVTLETEMRGWSSYAQQGLREYEVVEKLKLCGILDNVNLVNFYTKFNGFDSDMIYETGLNIWHSLDFMSLDESILEFDNFSRLYGSDVNEFCIKNKLQGLKLFPIMYCEGEWVLVDSNDVDCKVFICSEGVGIYEIFDYLSLFIDFLNNCYQSKIFRVESGEVNWIDYVGEADVALRLSRDNVYWMKYRHDAMLS